MLESTLKEQLKGIFAGLNANYTFDISISPAHESRQEMLDILGDVASCSDKISMRVSDGDGKTKKQKKKTRIFRTRVFVIVLKP